MRKTWKRFFSLALALMLCLSLFPAAIAEDAGSVAPEEDGQEGTIAPVEEGTIQPAEDENALPRAEEPQDGESSGHCGDDLNWSFDEGTGTLSITGSGDMWDWDWSGTYAPWDSFRTSITSVELPLGLTRIGNCAFYRCSGLTAVDIPVGVTAIGDYAFSNCSGLTAVDIPAGVSDIGVSAFSSCRSMASVLIPDSVTSFGSSVFSSCSALTSVDIPDGISLINTSMFRYCTSLEEVVIPSSVTFIGAGAFESCTKLSEMTFPDGLTGIGSRAFCRCTGLTNVVVPDGVKSIEAVAFGLCSSLSYMKLPESLFSLASDAFSDCDSLNEIHYDGTMETWRSHGFKYDLTRITICCSDGEILRAAPNQCGDSLFWSLNDGVLTISGSGDMWDLGHVTCWDASGVQEVILPDGLTSIGANAFYMGSRINEINIPQSVTSIGAQAFYSCRTLSSISLPDNLEYIGDSAFLYCSNLTEIRIPVGVRIIGSGVFCYCSKLTSMTIPEGVVKMGDNVFQLCGNLTEVSLPASLQETGSTMFYNCDRLTELYYGGSSASWERLNVEYDRNHITVHCSDVVIEPQTDTSQCGDDMYWSLENGTLTISGTGDMWNFYFYRSDSNIALSAAPWYDLRDEIRTIRILEGVRSIGSNAFSTYENANTEATSCTNLVSVELPLSMERIGRCAFAGCPNLKEIRLPDNLVEIGDYAFQQSVFDRLEIPAGVTRIGDGAFWGCSKLEKLTIPASVTEIGEFAFAYSNWQEIRFLGNAPTFAGNAFYSSSAKVLYPQNNNTWTSSVRISYEGNVTWESYLLIAGTLSVGQATACLGREFTLDLSLDKNPGVTVLTFKLDYDKNLLEFTGGEDGAFSGWTINTAKGVLVWDSDRDRTDTGCLIKLKFLVKEDAAQGETIIGITEIQSGNYNEETVTFLSEPGTVTLVPHTPGDSNGDGEVNVHDLTRIRKYLTGTEPMIVEGNTDVNADTAVDLLDLVRMRKYFAQEDIILE